MKIIFAFRTRLPFRSSTPARFRSGFASLPEKLSYLLCSCQSSSLITVSRPLPFLPLRFFSLGVLSLPSLLPLRPLLALSLSLRPSVSQRKNVGGLKWTRTIDLTLIRRVL